MFTAKQIGIRAQHISLETCRARERERLLRMQGIPWQHNTHQQHQGGGKCAMLCTYIVMRGTADAPQSYVHRIHAIVSYILLYILCRGTREYIDIISERGHFGNKIMLATCPVLSA